MRPSDLFQVAFVLLVIAPVAAAPVAFSGPPSARQIARIVLLWSWLADAAATAACVWYAFRKPSSGIGNQVFLLVAIPFALFACIWFGFWRAGRRHESLQSLPPEPAIARLEAERHE